MNQLIIKTKLSYDIILLYNRIALIKHCCRLFVTYSHKIENVIFIVIVIHQIAVSMMFFMR